MTRLRALIKDASALARVTACAVPLIFLHPHYQAHLAAGQVDVDLSDLAILAVVLAGIWSGLHNGFGPLAAGRRVWLATSAFLAVVVISTVWAQHADPAYALSSHVVSALKFVEYAFLAPAAALTLRRPADRRIFWLAAAIWAAVVTAIAVLQFVGALSQFRGRHPLDREPSYLGEHDFAAFSGALLSLAFAALLLRTRRRLGMLAGVAGGLGVGIAAAIDAVAGMWLAALALWAVARGRVAVTAQRTLALIAIAAIVTGAAFALRGSAVASFMRFLGVRPSSEQTAAHVQTWTQRVLLGYIGVEIWLNHPVLGVGWQESKEAHSYMPVLPAARKHFGGSQPPYAFPSPEHEWGVQNGVIQVLADLGLVGLALLLVLAWQVVRLVLRAIPRAPPFELLSACGWLVVGAAVFVGTGLLPGLTVDAQLWLGIGVVVALNDSLTSDG